MVGFRWSISRRVTHTNSPAWFISITGSHALSFAGMLGACGIVDYVKGIGDDDEEKAARGNRADSAFFTSLCGTWRFRYHASVENVGEEFYREDFDLSGWDTIPVPSNWQVFGRGHGVYRLMTSSTRPIESDDPGYLLK